MEIMHSTGTGSVKIKIQSVYRSPVTVGIRLRLLSVPKNTPLILSWPWRICKWNEFNQQLQGEFSVNPLLPRSNRQFSESEKTDTIPFHRLYGDYHTIFILEGKDPKWKDQKLFLYSLTEDKKQFIINTLCMIPESAFGCAVYAVYMREQDSVCGIVGIGRRARFRFSCLMACGFKSHIPH